MTAPSPDEKRRFVPSLDAWIALGLFLLVLALYLRTLAPSVLRIFDDSLEFQLVCSTLGIAHPTGYPLYTLLGYACARLIPLGDAAYRVNVLSALTGAFTTSLVYLAVVAGFRLIRPIDHWASRISGLVAGATLAASGTFWEYSTVAEVYTLNAAFLAAMTFLLVRWAETRTRGGLFLAALCFGFSLAHHRTMLLLVPIFLLFVASLDWRALLPDFLRRLAAVVLPLSLYLYIPWRGLYTTSLDGQYQNTVAGFFQWVLGLYSAWWQRVESWEELGANLAAYRDLVLADFTVVGVALALVGFLWLLWRQRPLALLLGLSYAGLTAFSVVYRGIGGFPTFFFIAPHVFLVMLVGIGIYAVVDLLSVIRYQVTGNSRHVPVDTTKDENNSRGDTCVAPTKRIYFRARYLLLAVRILYAARISCILFLSLPLFLGVTNFPARDVSQDTVARDAGLDVMSQPLEEGAAIVGILGETTLVRYFQETRGLRPDLVPVPANTEEERLAAVTEQLAAGRAVYITRPLPGAAERWYLSSAGPLVRVHTQPEVVPPAVRFPCDVEYANGVRLLGYDLAALNDGTSGPLPVESGKRLRVTLYWYAARPMSDDLLVFVHVLDQAGHRLGQDDAPPVRAAYPSSAWRAGEVVADAHDVRVLPGAPPGTYRLRVGWETPDGQALGVTAGGQAPLGSDLVGEFPVHRPVQPLSVADAQATIAHPMHVEFGDLILLGHDLEPVTVRPGDTVSFAVLWQAKAAPGADYGLTLFLRDWASKGYYIDVPLSPGHPTSQWVAGEIVRDHVTFSIPGDIEAGGGCEVYLGVRGPDGRTDMAKLPFTIKVAP